MSDSGAWVRFEVGHWIGWAARGGVTGKVQVWERCTLCEYATPSEVVGTDSPAVMGERRSGPIDEHDAEFHPETRAAMIQAAMKYLAGKTRANGQ